MDNAEASLKWKNTKKLACSVCCGPTGYRSSHKKPATCKRCRSESDKHGTTTGYNRGCRCRPCKDAIASAYLHGRHAREANPQKVCVEDGCDRAHRARGWCNMHYRRWARANGLDKGSSTWSDTRRHNYHVRRSRAPRSAQRDKVLLRDVIDRDGTACAGCGLPVDMDLTWPDRMYRSLDHIVPVSKGGLHTLDNVQLMHFTCNASKGNRVS